jgi:hypothetical protein
MKVAQERLSQVADHMSGGVGSSIEKGKGGKGGKGRAALLEKRDDDVSVLLTALMDSIHEWTSIANCSTHHTPPR